MKDIIRESIQAMLDTYSDGWSLSHFVIPMGLERVNSEGFIESVVWLYSPTSQGEYITNGLLLEAEALQHADQDTD